MRIHSLLHVPFEGIGSMAPYFMRNGHPHGTTRLYLDEPLPAMEAFDVLVVMGGPMGVSDEARFSWMQREKVFIKAAMGAGKRVLGICLGAQLIADVLGAAVTKNRYREIGWFPLTVAAQVEQTFLRAVLPPVFDAFHWHGDTFAIPAGAVPLAASAACTNQGFILDDRVVGFQFHLETTPDSAAALLDNCRDELDGSRYVQQEAEMMAQPGRFAQINAVMERVLEKLVR
jgi:GMP synthase-like glutamine amidotransferase